MTTATNDAPLDRAALEGATLEEAAVEGAAAAQQPDEPSSLRLVGTLLLAGLFSGIALVLTYELTLPLIKANQEAALQKAVFKVVPDAASMQKLSVSGGKLQAASGDEDAEVVATYDKAGKFTGYAILGEGPGFVDAIKLIFGFDPGRGRIVGMEVLESLETPGLGDKIMKDPAFIANFKDLAVKPEVVAKPNGKKSAPHEIDAITGATISSKAVVKIINGANTKWLSKLPATAPPAPKAGATNGGKR